ncbi:MAG: ABC transporter permease [Lachnospiraceae bacterium]|nr:ABC transporter permease [Lachnospiraceae bacterium]
MGTLLFLFVLLFLWQGMYWIGVDVLHLFRAYTLPAPIGVFWKFISLMENGGLLKSILYSLERGIWGFFLAALIGIGLGFLLYRFKYLRKNLKPIIMGIQTLPSVCWVPFSILWFGLSDRAILFVVIMGSAFSIAIAVEGAFRNIPPIYEKAALTMGASYKLLYLQVIFPASLPALISGLRQGWAFAWRALMSGEVMTTSIGLGQTLIMGRDLADINQVMLVMLLIIMVGILVDKCIFSSLEKHVFRKRGLEK